MADYEVDLSGDGFVGLLDVKLDNGEGPFEVRVLRKWALRDYCSSGKSGDVAIVLIDTNYNTPHEISRISVKYHNWY
jgi:hypothetical protein